MATHIENMLGVFGHGRHLALLISLLLLFLLSPLVAAARYGTVVINIAFSIVLLAGIYAMSEQRRLFVVALIGSVAAIATNLLMVVFQSEWMRFAWHGFSLLLLGLPHEIRDGGPAMKDCRQSLSRHGDITTHGSARQLAA